MAIPQEMRQDYLVLNRRADEIARIADKRELSPAEQAEIVELDQVITEMESEFGPGLGSAAAGMGAVPGAQAQVQAEQAAQQAQTNPNNAPENPPEEAVNPLVMKPKVIEDGKAGRREISVRDQLGAEIGQLVGGWRLQDTYDFATGWARPGDIPAQRKIERKAAMIDWETKVRANGMDPSEFDNYKKGGEITAEVLMTAVPIGGTARGVIGAGKRAIGEGTRAGVLEASKDGADYNEGQIGEFGEGFAWGSVPGVVLEAPQMVGTFVKRHFIDSYESDLAKKLRSESGAEDIPLSLGEQTAGQPMVRQAEASGPQNPGGPRAQFLANRNQKLQDNISNKVSQLKQGNTPDHQIVLQTKKDFEQYVDNQYSIASQQFKDDLGPVLEMTGARLDKYGEITGGFKMIETNNLQQEVARQLKFLKEGNFTGVSKKQLATVRDELMKLRRKGPMDLGDAQRTLQRLSKATAGSGRPLVRGENAIENLNPNTLIRAFNDDLASTASKSEANQAIVDMLQQSRKDYGAAIGEIERFKGTNIEKLLGGKDGIGSREFASKMINMEAGEFTELMSILGPQQADKVRGAVLSQVLDNATITDKVTDGSKVLGAKLWQDLGSMPHKKRMAFLNVSDPEMSKSLNRVFNILESIADANLEGGANAMKGINERLQGLAINAVSRSPEFVGREIMSEVAPTSIERMFFTPEGLAALSKLGKPAAALAKRELQQMRTFFDQAFRQREEELSANP